MIVAISQRTIEAEKGATRDALEQDYVEYYESKGMVIVPVPNRLRSVERLLDSLNVEGIILSGGNDSKERKETESKLIQYAMDKDIPLLAECHGLQFLNTFFGGKLVDIKEKTGQEHVRVSHEVEFVTDEVKQFLSTETMNANSYHDCGFTEGEMSSELTMWAKTADGSVEGVFHPKHRIAGFMWHPERDGCDEEVNVKIIDAFMNGKLFWGK